MLIPFARIPFIKQTFGDRIYSGEGCLLSCLYSTVEVILDGKKEICRLNVPKWRKLEELNVHSVTQRVLKEQFASTATQAVAHTYLTTAGHGGVKSIISGAQAASVGANAIGAAIQRHPITDFGRSTMKASSTGLDPVSANLSTSASVMRQRQQTSQFNNTSLTAKAVGASSLAPVRILSPKRASIAGTDRVTSDLAIPGNDDTDLDDFKRILINDNIRCRLKIGRLVK